MNDVMSETLLLAVDGGATKTDLVLFGPDGVVLNRVIGGPTNSSEIGFDRSTDTLLDLSEQLLSGFGGLTAPLAAVYAGLAGGGIETNKPRYRLFLSQAFPGASNIGNGSDAISAMNCGLRTGDGMVLIAGTGSSLFVRTGGRIHQVGGWGHLLSDEGSGYDIGRMGLRRVLQELDGRKDTTLMTGLFERMIGQPVDKAIPEIYEGGKRYISSFAPLVFEAAAAGDAAAVEILQASANELSRLLVSGTRFLSGPPYRVVFSGGLWSANDGILKKLVLEDLDEAYIPIKPEFPPVYGSVIEAMHLAGLQVDEAFDQTFKRSLSGFPILSET